MPAGWTIESVNARRGRAGFAAFGPFTVSDLHGGCAKCEGGWGTVPRFATPGCGMQHTAHEAAPQCSIGMRGALHGDAGDATVTKRIGNRPAPGLAQGLQSGACGNDPPRPPAGDASVSGTKQEQHAHSTTRILSRLV